MAGPVDASAHNVVTTDSKGVVVTVLRGRQTGDVVRALSLELQKHVSNLRTQDKRTLLLTDIRQLTASDSTSAGRLASKKLLEMSLDASAVVGDRGILAAAMYLARFTKAGASTRFFTSEPKARAWLESLNHPKLMRTSASLVAGIIVGLIGILALVGWEINNPYLIRGLSSLPPMNPMAAVGLIATGYGFICYWLGKLKMLKIAGIFGIVLGLSALSPFHVDHLLFGHRVLQAGARSQQAYTAGLCFIAIGVSPFTVGTKKFAVRILQYVLGVTIIGLSLFNIFGILYAHDFVYGLGNNFVMALNLAVAFLAVGAALVLLILYRQVGNVLGGVTRIGWLIVAALVFVQVATYSAWTQSVTRNKTNSQDAFLSRGDDLGAALDQRVQAYTNALHGFKGLFAASDYVNQGEFQSYYDSLDLAKTYPGLRALSFISKVQEKDLPAFVALHRADKSLHSGGNPAFAITAKSSGTSHYIVTYSATSVTIGGNDLGSNPSRLAAFQKADALGTPVSSGTVQFAASNGVPAQTGFFITIPVPSKASDKLSGHPPIGFVNAVFNYQDFFAHAFIPKGVLKGLQVAVVDTMDGTTVYSSNAGRLFKDEAWKRTLRVPVADHTWDMQLIAPSDYGISVGQRSLPRTILIGGQLFSLLLLVIFVLQTRARRQGFALADTLTEDLAGERNRAVANDQKSSAILSSIGDAVFAVDTNLRITLFNPSAQRISGWSESQALGKRYDEVLKFESEKDGRPNNHFIHEALGGKTTSMVNHTVLVRADGKRVPVADSAAPIRGVLHKIEGAIIVFRDVSKDYELDKAKTEFVSLASHELRTPLSAINWYGEMLLNGDAGKLTKTQHEYIKVIFQGNQRMVELVGSLLDASRLEVGTLANHPAPTDMSALIDDLQKELIMSIQEKQLVVTKAVSALQPVVADPKQLRMIIQNLLSNAVKYTPAKGSIAITLRKATAADLKAAQLSSTGPHWYFSVKDSGYGIPKAQQSKIFGKLFRADNVRILDTEGTGLGLYIVKEVVEKLGGRVWFESIESVGTTFYIVAPLHRQKGS